VGHSRTMPLERTLSLATRFLEEVRLDVGQAALDGGDIAHRLRCVHYRPGHATPEFRTLSIPVPRAGAPLPPDVLSGVIAHYAATRPPDCLFLAMEAEMALDDGGRSTVLIAEARDRSGTRLYWIQPFRAEGAHVEWDAPVAPGWRDPGAEEMILDAAFADAAGAAAVHVPAPASAGVGAAARAGRR
jgi:hypothetical protein